MTVVAAPSASLALGRVIPAGLQLIARQPLRIFLLAVLLAFLPAVASVWASAHLVPAQAAPGSADYFSRFGQRMGILELASLVIVGVNWMFQGAVVLCAVGETTENPNASALSVRLATRSAWLFVLGVATNVVVTLGTVALIVPGLLMSLAWCAGPAVAAVENRGFLAMFRRSADLTRGHRGQLFGLFLLYGVVRAASTFALRLAFGVPLLQSQGGPNGLVYVVGPAVSAACSVIYAAVMAAVYLELRRLHDGVAVGDLAATFD